MELPETLERFVGSAPPVASRWATEYVTEVSARQLAEAQKIGLQIDAGEDLITTNIAVGIGERWWDLMHDGYPQDQRNLGLAFIHETDGICDLIEHGRRYDRYMQKQSEKGQQAEPGKVDVIAVAVFRTIRTVFEVSSRREVRKLTNLVRVPPSQRSYLGNLH